MIKSTTQLTMNNPFDIITIGLAFCSIIIIGIYQYLILPRKISSIENKEKILEENYDELFIIDSENGPIWF